jgi:two-component system chemotaxis response regulator CheB
MPGRVSVAGIASATLPLWGIAGALKQRVNAGRPERLEAAQSAVSTTNARREMIHGLL